MGWGGDGKGREGGGGFFSFDGWEWVGEGWVFVFCVLGVVVVGRGRSILGGGFLQVFMKYEGMGSEGFGYDSSVWTWEIIY